MSDRLTLMDHLLDELCDRLEARLAPRIADEIVARLADRSRTVESSELVTLDAFCSQLPAAKDPKTWKGWLYERLRRGQVPGAVKFADQWWLRPAEVHAWLDAGAPTEAPGGM